MQCVYFFLLEHNFFHMRALLVLQNCVEVVLDCGSCMLWIDRVLEMQPQ